MNRPGVSAFLYALFVPVLAIMLQSAIVSQMGGTMRQTLVRCFIEPRNPGIFVISGFVALIAFAVIRPVAERPIARRLRFLFLVVTFALLPLSVSFSLVE